MAYVDGFIVPVPKNKVEDYKVLATKAGKIWMEYGAKAYVECAADDTPYGKLTSFPRSVIATDDETVFFSWIVYDSKESRDAINAKVMADPRIEQNVPFDGKRMIFGGFVPVVEF